MKTIKGRALVIDDEPDNLEIFSSQLEREGYTTCVASTWQEAEAILKTQPITLVLSDIHMPGKSGLIFLEQLRSLMSELPTWLFVTADRTPEILEAAAKSGALGVLSKPLFEEPLREALARAASISSDPLAEIAFIIQTITGNRLGPDKTALVETRVLRRARSLGLSKLSDYLVYFKKNRSDEVQELISVITTHTTEFFREHDHFDFLAARVFPKLFASGSFRMWSAACSSGEEVYSLGIAALEYAKKLNSAPPQIQLVGTDIDFSSIDTAQNGIYPANRVSRMSHQITEQYFERGNFNGQEFVRISDEVFKLCTFRQGNLLSNLSSLGIFDIIFLRNVLIYFSPKEVEQIAAEINKRLAPGGLLFIGHSESLSGLETEFVSIGHSIYSRKTEANLWNAAISAPVFKADNSCQSRLIVIDKSDESRGRVKKILSNEHGFCIVGEPQTRDDVVSVMSGLKPDAVLIERATLVECQFCYIEVLQEIGSKVPLIIVDDSRLTNVDHALWLARGVADYLKVPVMGASTEETEAFRQSIRKSALIKLNSFLNPLTANPKPSVTVPNPSIAITEVILIGASTGGVQALRSVVGNLPKETPPIVIVQHIPGAFSGHFAKSLNEIGTVKVTEAIDGENLEPSHVYVAPGGQQLKLLSFGSSVKIVLSDEPPLNHHKPSVDFMFESALQLNPEIRIVAALLTGMGADGAVQLKALRDAGHHTIAQSEQSCVVYGMPKVAIEMAAAVEVAALSDIATCLMNAIRKTKKAPSRAG